MEAAAPHVVVTLLGRRTHVLDLSREISPDIPIYPGHAKVAFWWHLTHDEVKQYRIGRAPRSHRHTSGRRWRRPACALRRA